MSDYKYTDSLWLQQDASDAQFIMGLIADLKRAQSLLDIDLEDAIDTLEARL